MKIVATQSIQADTAYVTFGDERTLLTPAHGVQRRDARAFSAQRLGPSAIAIRAAQYDHRAMNRRLTGYFVNNAVQAFFRDPDPDDRTQLQLRVTSNGVARA